jgi:hypothetical protein
VRARSFAGGGAGLTNRIFQLDSVPGIRDLKRALSGRFGFLRTTLRHGVVQGLDWGVTERRTVGRTDGLGVKNTEKGIDGVGGPGWNGHAHPVIHE